MSRTALLSLAGLLVVGIAAVAALSLRGKSGQLEPASAPSDLLRAEPARPDEMGKTFVNARVRPFGDANLYFEITVPVDWEGRKVEVVDRNPRQPVPLARITPNDDPDGKTAAIEVFY